MTVDGIFLSGMYLTIFGSVRQSVTKKSDTFQAPDFFVTRTGFKPVTF